MKPDKKITEKELGFEYPQKMVNWFSPTELLRAGVQATISSVFGNYADKREIQALQDLDSCPIDSLADCHHAQYHDQDEIYIDYIADLGDGWNPTFTMASLIAEPELQLSFNGQIYDTKRGSVLIMGGDQVYPTASKEEYKNRLWGPYESALPEVAEDEKNPDLYAVPGNHDWYDGLTSFSRLFFQGRNMGAWKTCQTRSYFALQLPHGWWLWGIDTQLDADLDLPQINYFKSVANSMPKGSKVITCVPEPEWLLGQQAYHGRSAYDSLLFIENEIFKKRDLIHAVSLAGDLHAYSRYENESGEKQRIMAGGGGAYLHATHKFPQTIEVPKDTFGQEFEKFNVGIGDSGEEAFYPTKKTSRLLALGALAFPLYAKSFCLIFGVCYLLIAWFTQSSSQLLEAEQVRDILLKVEDKGNATELIDDIDGGLMSLPPLDNVLKGEYSIIYDYCKKMAIAIINSPTAVMLVLLFCTLNYFFTQTKPRILKIALSVIHTSAHLFNILLLIVGYAVFNDAVMGLDYNSIVLWIGFVLYMLILGSTSAGLIIGLYLYFSHYVGHTFENEVLACRSIENYKNFLRLHINKEGNLIVFPIGVDKVEKQWVYHKKPEKGKARFTPLGTPILERAHLIESPIVIEGTPTSQNKNQFI